MNNSDDWWLLQTTDVEWMYIIDKLHKTVTLNPADPQYALGLVEGSNAPLHCLRKRDFSAEKVGHAIGLDVKTLQEHRGIIALKSQPQPKPSTVCYWGTA